MKFAHFMIFSLFVVSDAYIRGDSRYLQKKDGETKKTNTMTDKSGGMKTVTTPKEGMMTGKTRDLQKGEKTKTDKTKTDKTKTDKTKGDKTDKGGKTDKTTGKMDKGGKRD